MSNDNIEESRIGHRHQNLKELKRCSYFSGKSYYYQLLDLKSIQLSSHKHENLLDSSLSLTPLKITYKIFLTQQSISLLNLIHIHILFYLRKNVTFKFLYEPPPSSCLCSFSNPIIFNYHFHRNNFQLEHVLPYLKKKKKKSHDFLLLLG